MSKVIFITGGTRGIGHAIAGAMLHSGNSVAIAGTTADGVATAVSRLQSAVATATPDDAHPMPRVTGVTCDVRDAHAVERAIADVAASFGRIDVLVNCAGVGTGAPIAELSHDEWRRIIDTNLTGVFNCCKAVIPRMRASGSGWIVNISSLSSTGPFPGGAAYCASKAGVNVFSDALMQELRHDNIRVTVVLPGSVATGFSGRDAASGDDWKLQPEDVAHAIVDLLSHPSRSLPSRIDIRPARPRNR